MERRRRNKERWQGDERILGDGEFVEQVLSESKEQLSTRGQLQLKGWNIDKTIKHVCECTQSTEKDFFFRGKMGKSARARELFAYLAHRELGISGVELARKLNVSSAAVSKYIKHGEAFALKQDVGLKS
jgi:hypothetical protein